MDYAIKKHVLDEQLKYNNIVEDIYITILDKLQWLIRYEKYTNVLHKLLRYYSCTMCGLGPQHCYEYITNIPNILLNPSITTNINYNIIYNNVCDNDDVIYSTNMLNVKNINIEDMVIACLCFANAFDMIYLYIEQTHQVFTMLCGTDTKYLKCIIKIFIDNMTLDTLSDIILKDAIGTNKLTFIKDKLQEIKQTNKYFNK